MKNPGMIISAILIVAALVAGGAFLLQNNQTEESVDPSTTNRQQTSTAVTDTSTDPIATDDTAISEVFTEGELSAFDGLNGNRCLVAVDGEVYEVPEGTTGWQNGVHTSSGGLAECGQELTEVINAAPHGRSVLNGLAVIGVLE